VRIQAKTGYYAWPEDRSSRMKEVMRAIADTPFDAAEIGLRGAIEHTKGALRIRLRIETGDIVTIPDDDHHNARLDLAVLTYGQSGLLMGPATVSPINAFNLHLTDANLARALSEGIPVERDLPIDPAVTAVRLVVRDDNGGTTGSLTFSTDQLTDR
jgi:head-tail adaptor